MEGDEQLIEAVRGFSCLWMVKSKAYKDQTAKENAWKAISKQVNLNFMLQSLVCRVFWMSR